MALNPSGMNSYNWNCTKPDKEGYSLEITGTVVSIQEVQARQFNPNGGAGAPRFWDNGDPVFNIRIGLATPDGQLKSITMAEAGRAQREGRKPSLHMQLFNLSGGQHMMDLMGKTIHLWTWPAHPQTGQTWGQGNPRLYGVEEIQGARYELNHPIPDEFKVPKLLCDDGASGGQPVPTAPQYVQVPQQVPQYQQPAPQPMPQPAPQYQQPQYQQPVYQQPAPQVMQQPVQQPVQQAPQVQGMDPAVAQAMQAVQGTQPYQPAPPQVESVPLEAYGDVIPF